MAKNRFEEVKDISELLGVLGVDTKKVPEQTPLEKTRDALRRRTAEEIDKIYANTIKAVGKELEFSSARHLVTGLYGLIFDSVYTLWDPVKKITSSPFVSQLVEDEIGEGKTFLDYLVAKGGENKSPDEREKQVQKLTESFESFRKSEAYAQAITDRCAQTNKTPYAILKSKKELVKIIQEVYGSVEEYEKH